MTRSDIQTLFTNDEGAAFEWVLAVFCRMDDFKYREDLMTKLFKIPPDEIKVKALAVYDILFGTEGSDA
jgi:hypothetical protein